MTSAFLDTVGLLAIWNRADQWHGAASQALARIQVARTPVLTTRFVLAECANAAARRPYRLDVDVLRENLEDEGMLISPTDDDWRAAWEGYRRGEAGGAGLVDQLSFAVMRRLLIDDAFTNDRHFRAAGFRILF